jgi:dipeptidase D
MTGILEGIEPAGLWRNFETLATIPRPSRAEEAVIAHVRAWAAGKSLEVGSYGLSGLRSHTMSM